MLDNFPEAIFEADRDFGWIPLHYAAHLDNVEVVKLFLEKDTSIAYKKDKEGMSALHISANEGHVNVMRTLITKCPYTCELLDKKSRTALHLAVKSGKEDAVAILLEELAFRDLINEQDEDGNTPLHLAAINGLYPILMKLAENKRVDNVAMNKKGMIAAEIIQLDKQLLVSQKEIIMSKWNRHVVLPRSKRVDDSQTMEVQEKRDPAEDVKNGSESHLTAITLVITVTFAVSTQVPGGYDSTGKPVLEKNNKFQNFLFFDALAFGISVGLLFIHLCILAVPGGASPWLIEFAKRLTRPILGLSVFMMIIAFIKGLESVLDEKSYLPLSVLFLFSMPPFLCYTASQELKLLENQLTAIKRAEERKTCKRQESDRSGHRFGAGLGGSDAFVSRIIHVAFRRPLDLGTCGGFMALHLAGSGQLVHGAGRRYEGFIPRIRGGHLCTMSHWLKRQWKTFTLRETLRKQVKGLEADLQKKDDLLSSQDDTRRFYVGGFEHISENEDEEDEVQSKEHAVTPFDVQSTSPSGDQSGDPAVSLMDG
uniref:PGG domain-containing protein n=1 Tax=Fagus sylvatica TaxID=28930 RepID=A0A2N9GFF8_FAGSY